MKFNTSVLVTVVLVFGALFFAACGGATNTASNTTTTNKTNTAATNTTPTSSPAANTAGSNSTATAPAGDSVGVPECDEYIKKYEACLTKVAAKAPQIESTLKTAFQAQRDAFKKGAETPQGKAALAPGCKQALDAAKSNPALSSYACEW